MTEALQPHRHGVKLRGADAVIELLQGNQPADHVDLVLLEACLKNTQNFLVLEANSPRVPETESALHLKTS